MLLRGLNPIQTRLDCCELVQNLGVLWCRVQAVQLLFEFLLKYFRGGFFVASSLAQSAQRRLIANHAMEGSATIWILSSKLFIKLLGFSKVPGKKLSLCCHLFTECE